MSIKKQKKTSAQKKTPASKKHSAKKAPASKKHSAKKAAAPKRRRQKTWADVLEGWKNGECVTYPKSVKRPFFYETTPITKDFEKKGVVYRQKFVTTDKFNGVKEDYSRFKDYIDNSFSNHAVAFMNLAGTSALIVPMPRKSMKFTTMKHFVDKASKTQQAEFWKLVEKNVRAMLDQYDKIWVSTHGTGVPFFHLRLDSVPKYYVTKEFKQ